jgi:hypothetical protein
MKSSLRRCFPTLELPAVPPPHDETCGLLTCGGKRHRHTTTNTADPGGCGCLLHQPSSRSSQQSLAERSTPQFRSETDWKLTPGGHGLYGMNCPRSQVASVVDRPTTAMYAKDAEIAYYTKQPGAPSPLLWELWARREPSTAHNNSLERVAPPMASPVSHNFTAAVDKQTLQKNPLTEYLSVGPRNENHPGGLFYELGVRVHQVLQDHPTISKVSSVSSPPQPARVSRQSSIASARPWRRNMTRNSVCANSRSSSRALGG